MNKFLQKLKVVLLGAVPAPRLPKQPRRSNSRGTPYRSYLKEKSFQGSTYSYHATKGWRRRQDRVNGDGRLLDVLLSRVG